MKKQLKSAILLLSGGIDSTTLLHEFDKNNINLHCLIFDYGQSLKKEINIAKRNALSVEAIPIIVKIDLTWLNSECPIINDTQPIPKNRTMSQIKKGAPKTYVPFRNGIFLSYAVAYGESNKIKNIYCGGNGLNSGNYYDDTTFFAEKFQAAAEEGTSLRYKPKIIFPYSLISKKQIVERGIEIGVDYKKTWSCYLNGKIHCGQCDSCKQREVALCIG